MITKLTMVENNACFFISAIGEPGSEEREHTDEVFEHLIKPALEGSQYKPIRSHEVADSEMITNAVVEYLVESPLVVADLTYDNPNVFYELAIRHAYNKPFIQIMRNDEDIPFDLANTRTVHYGDSMGAVRKAESEIEELIQKVDNNEKSFENPVTVAENIKNLKESTDPEEQSMAKMMEDISDLKSELTTIEKVVTDPEELLPPEYINEVHHGFSDLELKDMYELTKKIDEINKKMGAKKSEDSNIAFNKTNMENLIEKQNKLIEKLRKQLNRHNPETRSLSDF